MIEILNKIEQRILLTVNRKKTTHFRGTKLLADRMHEMHSIQLQREQETLDNVKAKVARIKANQRKYEPDLIAAKTHHEGKINVQLLCNLKCTSCLCIFQRTAVQYRGKYLYEELVEEGEFDPRQNESKIEMEESYVLKNHNRIDATFRDSNTLRGCESRCQINESAAECDGDKTTSNYYRNNLVLI